MCAKKWSKLVCPSLSCVLNTPLYPADTFYFVNCISGALHVRYPYFHYSIWWLSNLLIDNNERAIYLTSAQSYLILAIDLMDKK